MKNAPMRFAGYTMRHNPAKLKIEDAARVVGILPPGADPDSLHLGRGLRAVRGEGELYGADCIAQYRELCSLYERGGKGLLSLPQMPPMTAYLKELRLTAEPQEDVLGFAFTFIEAQEDRSAVSGDAFYTVTQQGESLWDIAYAHDCGIDTLVRLNPQIEWIDELHPGEKVRLC